MLGSRSARRTLRPMARARHRGNGDGTTYKVPGRRKPWAASVTVGWTLEGRPIRRARYASSEREAKMLLEEMKAARESGSPMPDDRLTVGKWLVTWLRLSSERSLRPTTMSVYTRAVRLMLPELGSIPLRKLNSSQVETMLRLFPAPTAVQLRSVLSAAMKDAMRARHIATNEAALARGPRNPRRGLPAPDVATVRAILGELEGHRLSALYVLLAGTGLRIGEATGLRWEDIDDGTTSGRTTNDDSTGARGAADGPAHAAGGDRDPRPTEPRNGDRGRGDGRSDRAARHSADHASSLTVRYQLQRIDGEHVLTDPKTDTAGRVVFLPPVLQAALRAHKAHQAAERLQAGRKWRKADLVFTTAEGEPVSESTAHWILSHAAKRAGVRHVSLHDLRRFYLSTVQDAVGMEAAQLVAGHTNPKQTAAYVTVRDRLLTAAATAAEEALR